MSRANFTECHLGKTLERVDSLDRDKQINRRKCVKLISLHNRRTWRVSFSSDYCYILIYYLKHLLSSIFIFQPLLFLCYSSYNTIQCLKDVRCNIHKNDRSSVFQCSEITIGSRMVERAQAELTKFQNTHIFRWLCNDRFYSRRIKANSRYYCAIPECDRIRSSIKGNPRYLASSVLVDACSGTQYRIWYRHRSVYAVQPLTWANLAKHKVGIKSDPLNLAAIATPRDSFSPRSQRISREYPTEQKIFILFPEVFVTRVYTRTYVCIYI